MLRRNGWSMQFWILRSCNKQRHRTAAGCAFRVLCSGCYSPIKLVIKKLILATFMAITGCTSISNDVEVVTAGSSTSEILVYRESKFHASATGLYVGKNDKYFMKLKNGQFSTETINSGKHIFQAKADASPASTIDVELAPGETVCLKAEPNPETLKAIAFPIIGNILPTFLLKKVDCPTEAELSEYVFSKGS